MLCWENVTVGQVTHSSRLAGAVNWENNGELPHFVALVARCAVVGCTRTPVCVCSFCWFVFCPVRFETAHAKHVGPPVSCADQGLRLHCRAIVRYYGIAHLFCLCVLTWQALGCGMADLTGVGRAAAPFI
ncbi:unnamed protein product [Discosporangium mesarthrocarpum]